MSSQTSRVLETATGKHFQAEVDLRLEQILQRKIQAAPTPPMSELWQFIAKGIQGGKRTRPMLVGHGYRVVSDLDEPRLVEIGCAFELLHAALVMHDDVIDQDFVRRGEPTLSAHYRNCAAEQNQNALDAEHIGHSAALLAGDVLISLAIQLMHESCRDLSCGAAVMEVFHEAIQMSAAGELDDVLFSARIETPDLDDVLRMHRLKTAAYSFEAPLRAGALLAGAPDYLVDELGEFGNLLGSCYQIIDDVLGTFGDSSTTGKPNDSDLREGKFTVLIALAETLPAASGAVKQWRTGAISNQAMRAVLESHEIEQKARRLAEQCSTAAMERLGKLPISAEVYETFVTLVDTLLERRS